MGSATGFGGPVAASISARIMAASSPVSFSQRPMTERSAAPGLAVCLARRARPKPHNQSRSDRGAAAPVALATESVSVSVSGALRCVSPALHCVTSRFTASRWRSRWARTRCNESSSLFGWRTSQAESRSPVSTLPCIALRIASTCSGSISSAAATSSSDHASRLPFALEAATSMKLNTAIASAIDRPDRLAITRHLGSVGMSSQRRTQAIRTASAKTIQSLSGPQCCRNAGRDRPSTVGPGRGRGLAARHAQPGSADS